MSAVVEVIEDVGRGIGNFIGDVVETVGDVIEGVVDVAGDILQGVGNVVGKVVESALDDPLGSIAKVAAIATGQFHLLPVISATSVVANGGSFEDALKAGAIGYVTQGVAQYVGGGAFDANADFVAYDAQQLAAQGFGREQIADILGASGVNATAAAAAATAASEGLGQANVLEAIRLSADSANPIFVDATTQAAQANGGITDLVDNGFTSEVQRTLADQGISLQDQIDLAKQGTNAADVSVMAENGFSSEVQRTLADQGISIQDQIDLAKQGATAGDAQVMAENGFTSEIQRTLADQGISIQDQVDLVKQGATAVDAQAMAENGFTGQVQKAFSEQGVSIQDQIDLARTGTTASQTQGMIYTAEGEGLSVADIGKEIRTISEITGVSPTEALTLKGYGYDANVLQDLRDSGFTADQINRAVDLNLGPDALSRYTQQGYTPDQILEAGQDLNFSEFTTTAPVGASLSESQPFLDRGYSQAQIDAAYDPNGGWGGKLLQQTPGAPVAPVAPVMDSGMAAAQARTGWTDLQPRTFADGKTVYYSPSAYGGDGGTVSFDATGTPRLQAFSGDPVASGAQAGTVYSSPNAVGAAPPAPVAPEVGTPGVSGPVAPPLTELNAAQTEELMRNVDPGMINNLAPVKSGTAGGTVSSLLNGPSLNPITNIVTNLGVTDPTIIGALTGAGTSAAINLVTGQPITGQSILQGALGGGVAGTIGAALPDMGGGTIGSALAGAATNVGATVVVNAVTGQPITGATLAGAALTGGVIGAAVPMVTDRLGNTTYQYDDGSSMTVNSRGTPVAVTDFSGASVPVAAVDSRTGEPARLAPVEDAVPSPVDSIQPGDLDSGPSIPDIPVTPLPTPPAPVPGDFDSGPSIPVPPPPPAPPPYDPYKDEGPSMPTPGVPVNSGPSGGGPTVEIIGTKPVVSPPIYVPPVNQPYDPYKDEGPSQPTPGVPVTDLPGDVPTVEIVGEKPVKPDPVYVPEIEIVAPRPVTPPPMPSPDDDFPPTPEPPMPSPDEDFPPTPEPTPEPTPVTPPVYPPIYVPQPPVVTPPPLAPLPPINWGDVGRVNLPGTNPGWFTNVPEQYAPQGIRSQYYWGQHPYQTGERFSPEQYRQVPAPVAPWGLQQLYTPQTIEDLLRGVGQAATKPSAPRV